MELTNKNIVVVSPQMWAEQHLSKHHYAIELSNKGNTVIFVSSPEKGLGLNRHLRKTNTPGLFIAEYHVPLPLWVSFQLPWLYFFLCRLQIARLIKSQMVKPDVCIDFGHTRLFPDLKVLKAQTTIFFPVDDSYSLKEDLRGANFCFSVSKNIVERFKNAGIPCQFVNHGLSNLFTKNGKTRLEKLKDAIDSKNSKIKVCYSGNIMIPFLDRSLVKAIVLENPDCEFHFLGKSNAENNNESEQQWESWLKSQKNITLHGVLRGTELVEKMDIMDVFLLCYIPDNVNYHGENSHKILEYLSTGKVIVSTPISLYQDSTLIEFATNELFPLMLSNVLQDLDYYNRAAMQEERISFALCNSYANQIERIEQYINQSKNSGNDPNHSN